MADDDEFARLLAESEGRVTSGARIREGDGLRGRVVGIGTPLACVALGGQAGAVLALEEFRAADGSIALKVGDEIEATVTDDGSRSGSVLLKRTLGRGGHVPGELEQALAHGIPVEGVVTGQNKGGFDVQVAGVRAFCPASQIDLRRGDPATYVGQRLRFRVTRIEAGGRNVVVSRRDLLAEEEAARAAATWKELAVGRTVRATVTSLRDFGAFADLGGVEGLIHVSELGHQRAAHPSEVLAVGQQVEAQIVKIEPAAEGRRARIGLSLRALAPDPWATAVERFAVGAAVTGTVRKVEAFGAFVELAPGIDGLVHVSRMALDRRVAHARQVVSVGDRVEVTVVALDVEKRRIGLSMVEQAKRQRDQTEETERRETEEAIASLSTPRGFGTLGDLLTRKRT